MKKKNLGKVHFERGARYGEARVMERRVLRRGACYGEARVMERHVLRRKLSIHSFIQSFLLFYFFLLKDP
jgi:hypothetical protein